MSEFEEAFCNSTKKSMTFKNGTVLEEGNKFLMRQILGNDADLECKEGTVEVINVDEFCHLCTSAKFR